jgi:dienelactone hydrolase
MEASVSIPSSFGALPAKLSVPDEADSLIIFSHGAWGSALECSAAEILGQARHGVLIFDDEVRDVDQLTARFVAAADWVLTYSGTCHLSVGCLGVAEGAVAALRAAAERPWGIGAVVPCGGRLLLADEELDMVRAPALLIVSGSDTSVVATNRHAMERLHETCELKILAGADPRSTAPASLGQVSREARAWFGRHLGIAQTEPVMLHS